MERFFIAYLASNGKIIEKDGYDVIVKEIDGNKYQELITGRVLENYKYSNDDISVCLCYRIDSTLQRKQINNYLRYEVNRVNSIINNSKVKKLSK